jgi:hypothetical protein
LAKGQVGVTIGGLPYVGGLNLTLFNITAIKTASAAAADAGAPVGGCPPHPQCIPPSIVAASRVATRFGRAINTALTITIWPLVSGTDANTPVPPLFPDYTGKLDDLQNFTFPQQQDGVRPLPTIEYKVNARQKCFYVVLPVQLFTLQSVGQNFTFTQNDLLNPPQGTPYNQQDPNMEVLAVKLKGTFVDETGTQNVPAALAAGIQFKIVSPAKNSPVSLTLTYQENKARSNRPIYCFEGIDGGYAEDALDAYIPIFDPDCAVDLPFNPSLLFTPRCSPGIYSNFVNPTTCPV